MYRPEDFEDDIPVPQPDPARLTPEERAVLDKLVEAYELYIQLPVQHPLHPAEFTRSLHELQRLVMARPTSRVEGWVKDEDGNPKQPRLRVTRIDPDGNREVIIDKVAESHPKSNSPYGDEALRNSSIMLTRGDDGNWSMETYESIPLRKQPVPPDEGVRGGYINAEGFWVDGDPLDLTKE